MPATITRMKQGSDGRYRITVALDEDCALRLQAVIHLLRSNDSPASASEVVRTAITYYHTHHPAICSHAPHSGSA